VNRTTRELEALGDELAQASQRIDSLSKGLQELMARVGKLEDSVNISAAAAHAMQDAQQAIEKRFELQAGVIRSLNNAMQAREDRLDKLLGAFQMLQGVAQERPARRGVLPDDL
jgi:predicted  nucleic acid-binding Zn-ribbon protein